MRMYYTIYSLIIFILFLFYSLHPISDVTFSEMKFICKSNNFYETRLKNKVIFFRSIFTRVFS